MAGPAVTAALAALFAWWFSTGLILLVVRRADRSGLHALAVIAGLPVLALGLAALAWSLPRADLPGIYVGFMSALAVWGWIELAFLTGIVAGPNRQSPPPGLAGPDRLWRAWTAISHHELLLAFGLLVVVVASTGAENQTALWTYLILFAARISAKVNLFLGVPHANVEFVPRPLAHLTGHFRRGPATPVFAASVTLLSFAAACLVFQIVRAASAPEAAAHALLAALTALALLEHWMMVVPLPDAVLWRWMLPAAPTEREPWTSTPSSTRS